MTIQAFFYSDTLTIGVVSLAITVASAMGAHWLVFHSRLFAPARGRLVVAPFFVSTASLFALFLAFNASHAWTNDGMARRAAAAERAAIERILHVTSRFHPQPAEAAAPVRAYLAAVVEQEWGAARNRAASPAAVAALARIEDMVWRARAGGMDPGLAEVLVRAIDALETARAARIGLAADVGDAVRWVLLLVLGFAALVSMSLCHADRPETARVAGGVFALAIGIATAVSAMYESPYTGLFAVGPERLAELLATLPPPR